MMQRSIGSMDQRLPRAKSNARRLLVAVTENPFANRRETVDVLTSVVVGQAHARGSCALFSNRRAPHALMPVDTLFVLVVIAIVAIHDPARSDDDTLDEPVLTLLAVILMTVVSDRVEIAHALLRKTIATHQPPPS